MNRWNSKIYYTSSVRVEIAMAGILRFTIPALSGLKLQQKLLDIVLVGPLNISTGIQNANARTGFKSQKCM